MVTHVAVGILRKDRRILACQRREDARYGLKWEFPGGKLEPGETVFDCLRRELREELSIDLQSIERIEVESAFYEDGGTFEVSYCHVSEFTGEPVNRVFRQIRWVTPEELAKLDILHGNRNVVKRLASR
jgi:mutator protein MutT